jgi:hypothetical protein
LAARCGLPDPARRMTRLRLNCEPGGEKEAQGEQNERTTHNAFSNDDSASPEWWRELRVGLAEADGGQLSGCCILSDLGRTIWGTFGRSVERRCGPGGISTPGLGDMLTHEGSVSRRLASQANPEDGCPQSILVSKRPMSRATSLERPWAQSKMPQGVDADRFQLNGRSHNAGLVEVRERSIEFAQDPPSLGFTPWNEGGIVRHRRHCQRRSLEDDVMKSTVIPAGIDVHQVGRTPGRQGLGDLNERVPIFARIDDDRYPAIEHAIDGTIGTATRLGPMRRLEYVAIRRKPPGPRRCFSGVFGTSHDSFPPEAPCR